MSRPSAGDAAGDAAGHPFLPLSSKARSPGAIPSLLDSKAGPEATSFRVRMTAHGIVLEPITVRAKRISNPGVYIYSTSQQAIGFAERPCCKKQKHHMELVMLCIIVDPTLQLG